MVRSILGAFGVFLVCSLPFLVDDAGLFFERLTMQSVEAKVADMRWVGVLEKNGVPPAGYSAGLALDLGALSLFALASLIRADKWMYAALSFTFAIPFAGTMKNNVLMWAMVFFAMVFIHHRRLLSLGAVVGGCVCVLLFGIETIKPYKIGGTTAF